MSTPTKGFIVSLEHDLSEERAELTLNAIRAIRGVASVEAVSVNAADHLNRSQIRLELKQKLWDALEK